MTRLTLLKPFRPVSGRIIRQQQSNPKIIDLIFQRNVQARLPKTTTSTDLSSSNALNSEMGDEVVIFCPLKYLPLFTSFLHFSFPSSLTFPPFPRSYQTKPSELPPHSMMTSPTTVTHSMPPPISPKLVPQCEIPPSKVAPAPSDVAIAKLESPVASSEPTPSESHLLEANTPTNTTDFSTSRQIPLNSTGGTKDPTSLQPTKMDIFPSPRPPSASKAHASSLCPSPLASSTGSSQPPPEKAPRAPCVEGDDVDKLLTYLEKLTESCDRRSEALHHNTSIDAPISESSQGSSQESGCPQESKGEGQIHSPPSPFPPSY